MQDNTPRSRLPTLPTLHRFHLLRHVALAFVVILALVMGSAPLAAQSNNTVGSVNSSIRLNVRSGPGTSYAVISRLDPGASVTILGANDGGDWLRIALDGASGEAWVAAAYIAQGNTPVETGEAAPQPPAASAALTGVTANANVRGGPGTNYPVITTLSAGSVVELLARSPAGDWYQVKAPNVSATAWVYASLVTVKGNAADLAVAAPDALPAAPAVAAPVAAAPAAAPINVPAPAGGGDFAYGITAQMWQSDKEGVANHVRNLGFTWVKQQVRWEFVETSPGAINWQEMDGIVNTMNTYGINVMFSVVTAPDWTRPTKGGTNGPPEDFQLFANFMGQIAGRYCGQSLAALEVWNEQNLQREWEGYALDPALYMDLLRRTYGAVKGACPSMLVISGATTPAGYSDVAFDDIDYLRGMYQNGLARYSDGVGIHPSGFANPPTTRFQDWQSGAYSAESHVNHRSFYFRSTLEESRGVMEQFGDSGKRLWPTEFGWGSTPSPHPGYEYEGRINEGQQAQWIVDAYRLMAGSGYVATAFLWNLDYNYGEMAAFSVIGRPAYDALKRMTGR